MLCYANCAMLCRAWPCYAMLCPPGDEFDEGEEPAEGDNDEAEPEEGV